MAEDGPIDRGQRRLAERRLLNGLRRLHRREPMRPEIRLDAVLEAARRLPASRATGHRGSAPLTLDDTTLRRLLEEMAAQGRVVMRGRWLRLPDHEPRIDPLMRERVERLLAGLREAGSTPPRVDGPAARLGIPGTVVDALRTSGELVAVAPGIDYPREVWEDLRERVQRMAASGPLNVARTRDGLRTTRRHAEAILDRWRSERRRERGASRRQVRSPDPGARALRRRAAAPRH